MFAFSNSKFHGSQGLLGVYNSSTFEQIGFLGVTNVIPNKYNNDDNQREYAYTDIRVFKDISTKDPRQLNEWKFYKYDRRKFNTESYEDFWHHHDKNFRNDREINSIGLCKGNLDPHNGGEQKNFGLCITNTGGKGKVFTDTEVRVVGRIVIVWPRVAVDTDQMKLALNLVIEPVLVPDNHTVHEMSVNIERETGVEKRYVKCNYDKCTLTNTREQLFVFEANGVYTPQLVKSGSFDFAKSKVSIYEKNKYNIWQRAGYLAAKYYRKWYPNELTPVRLDEEMRIMKSLRPDYGWLNVRQRYNETGQQRVHDIVFRDDGDIVKPIPQLAENVTTDDILHVSRKNGKILIFKATGSIEQHDPDSGATVNVLPRRGNGFQKVRVKDELAVFYATSIFQNPVQSNILVVDFKDMHGNINDVKELPPLGVADTDRYQNIDIRRFGSEIEIVALQNENKLLRSTSSDGVSGLSTFTEVRTMQLGTSDVLGCADHATLKFRHMNLFESGGRRLLAFSSTTDESCLTASIGVYDFNTQEETTLLTGIQEPKKIASL